MFLRRFLLVVVGIILYDCTNALQCLDNCSMNYSMSQSFVLPNNCTTISARHCEVKLVFWYDRRNYIVTFTAGSLHDHYIPDDRHFIMIETAKKQKFFSYDIDYICKDTDDCAQIYAQRQIKQATQRSFNLSNIYADLQRILYEKSFLSRNLACFDMNDAVKQCTIPGMSGSCQIIDDLIKHKFHRRLCLHSAQQSTSVNIYDSGHFAMMTVKCNRMLCNGPLTIAAVKKILKRHNITDEYGRIPGSHAQILLTSYLFILMTFISLFRLEEDIFFIHLFL